MWVKYNLPFLVIVIHVAGYYIEYVNIGGCESCALRLTCRDFASMIAIVEIGFLPIGNSSELLFDGRLLRMALNKRCSGLNHCSFILTKDCPGAEKWGFGNLTIKYACIAEQRITKYCNSEIILPTSDTFGISQGVIHNPGYPRFYVGGRNCQWRIRAPSFQKIKITIFDITLVGDPNKSACKDKLLISDPSQLLLSACTQEEPPREVVSLGDTLEVTLAPSLTEGILPTRGVLFYYSVIGCSVLHVPDNAFLVSRNDTIAEFSCCLGFVFPDTQSRRRFVICTGHQWDTPLPLPNCHDENEISYNNSSKDLKASILHKMVTTSTLEEIVIPSIIIVILFLINSIILFMIYRYRKRCGNI